MYIVHNNCQLVPKGRLILATADIVDMQFVVEEVIDKLQTRYEKCRNSNHIVSTLQNLLDNEPSSVIN